MRVLSGILAIALTCSSFPFSSSQAATHEDGVCLDALKARFPDARFIEVSPSEYARQLAKANGNAVILLANGTDPSVEEETKAEPEPKESEAADEHRSPPPPGAVVPARVSVGPRAHFAGFGEGTGSIATDDLAVILYVIVGAVVIAAAFLYGGLILVEILSGHRNYPLWQDIAISSWVFGGSGRRGGMYGSRATIGILGDFNRVGLVLEGGYLDGRFRLRDADGFQNVHGIYGLLGTSIQWPLTTAANPVSWDFEVLTGYSTADRVGLMSRALTGFSWGIGARWRMGIMAGSTYAKIRETEGPLRTESDFNLTGGGWFGARF